MAVVTEPANKDPAAIAAARRRRRSIALALALGGLAVIFYVLTIVKMGPGIFDRVL